MSNDDKDSDKPSSGGFSSAPSGMLRPRHSRIPTMPAADSTPPTLSPKGGPEGKAPEGGTLLDDRYTLLKLLGEGAMGRVYRGIHEGMGTPVAIKVMRRSMVDHPEYARRFAREARAASLLNHPNAVRVLDFGNADGMPYIVMEYIEGGDLDSWLDELYSQGELPAIEAVVELGAQILAALDAAHELGIVHRDLKPENVMLAKLPDGQRLAKVTDFGLAHVDDPRDAGPTLTQNDAVAGTPAFMSPEQCRSLQVGHSTDLYAFGCVLTCLLQGSPPFEGETPMDVISQQLFVEPPGLSRPPTAEPVPPLLEKLRLELLAKKAYKRPESAREARTRLLEALSAEANAAAVPTRKGDEPLGGRSARSAGVPDAEPHTARPEKTLNLDLRRVSEGAEGFTQNLLTGLAAHGVRAAESEVAEALLLDAGTDLDSAVAWLEQHADERRPKVVCLQKLSTEGMNTLIAAGASDVARYPLEPAPLARKLRRALRRRK